MSIRRRWWSKRANDLRGRGSGFTLVELLVVVSIIALLISILLPSLTDAREQARMAKCAAHIKSLATGLAVYAVENNDWFPGYNTTGVPLRAMRFLGAGAAEAMQQPYLPVQTFDWMSPLLNVEMKMPARRVDRLRLLLERYNCPSVNFFSDELFGVTGSPDRQDFEEDTEPWPVISYLMPAHFQFWGQNDEGKFLAANPLPGFNFPIESEAASLDWEVRVDNYVSRVDRVGTPADKVCFADGTRYLDQTGILDFDVDPYASTFGAFTSSGAWWAGSRAYGVQAGTSNWDGKPVNPASPNPNEGGALPLSYRHMNRKAGNGSCQANRGKINAAFFDGHVEPMNDQQSREIHYWYPKGAVVQTPDEGMTDLLAGYIVR